MNIDFKKKLCMYEDEINTTGGQQVISEIY